MAFWDTLRFTKKAIETAPQMLFVYDDAKPDITETKGNYVALGQGVQVSKEIGEAHPFEFEQLDDLYKQFGIAQSAIDKYVDAAVGQGFYFVSENEKAKKLVEEFFKKRNFDRILRPWLRDGFLKGNGFIEVSFKEGEPSAFKNLNANTMFIKRDVQGSIEGYTQHYPSQLKGPNGEELKDVSFKPGEILHFAYNTIGDSAYGYGFVQPAFQGINNYLASDKWMHTIMKRKANWPMVWQVGNKEKGIYYSQAEMTKFAQQFYHMNEKTDYVVPPDVNPMVLNFGSIGDRFQYVLDHDMLSILYTFQIPEVLMGKGNIPEGLARVQTDAFMLHVQSIQSEAERIIEIKIINKLLEANGMAGEHVEMEWNKPQSVKREELTTITNILSSSGMYLEPQVIKALQKRYVDILNLEVDEEEKPPEAPQAPQQPPFQKPQDQQQPEKEEPSRIPVKQTYTGLLLKREQ